MTLVTDKDSRKDILQQIDGLKKESIKLIGLTPDVAFRFFCIVEQSFTYIESLEKRIKALEKENNDLWHRTHPESMGR